MAELIAPNSNDPQEMAKQVEAIAEAAAQRDSQIAQMLNLVPKAAALSAAASRAIDFTKKTWVDDPTSGTPITAADMNRLEQAIVDLNTTLTSLQDSVSQGNWNAVQGQGYYWCRCGNVVILQVYNIQLDQNVTKQFGSLPDAIRPTCTLSSGRAAVGVVVTNEASTSYVGYLYVNSDGTLTAWSPTSGQFTGQVAYLSATE